LSPNSDKHLISPYNILACSNIQVARIKGIITKHEMPCMLFVQMLSTSTIRSVCTKENMHINVGAQRVIISNMTPSYLTQGTAGNGLFVSGYVASCLSGFGSAK